MITDYKSNHSTADAKTTLNNIWQTLTNAGVLNKQATQSYENLNVSFTTPNETSDGLFTFADISVKFNNYGDFQLMFIVDGIESPLSSVMTVTSKKEEIKKLNVFFYLFIIRINFILLEGNYYFDCSFDFYGNLPIIFKCFTISHIHEH